MKHVKRFIRLNNIRDINDILNIARDKGLGLLRVGLNGDETQSDTDLISRVYIDRYRVDDEQERVGEPIISNDEFIETITNIYKRLISEDFIESKYNWKTVDSGSDMVSYNISDMSEVDNLEWVLIYFIKY